MNEELKEELKEENETHRKIMDLTIAISELKAENYLLKDILGQLLKIKLLSFDDEF